MSRRNHMDNLLQRDILSEIPAIDTVLDLS